MADLVRIKVDGLRELQASLKALDGESQKQLRLALNDAVGIVVRTAGPRVPTVSGRARGSIKPASSQREARIQAGGSRAPYYPWLDFGGRTGRGRTGPRTGSVNRPFLKEGRYLWAAYADQQPAIARMLEQRLGDVARGAGLDVTSGG